jgi:hypothetical protein
MARRRLSFLVAVLAISPALAREDWCLQQAEDESHNLVIITVDRGFEKLPNKADFPWLLQINLHSQRQNKNGHPTDEEAKVLNSVEDGLTAALRKVTDLRYTGRATTKGARELVYYVKDAEKANRLLTQLAKDKQVRAWEFGISKDPKWRHYDDLVGPDPHCL